jgi:hypothetical protein
MLQETLCYGDVLNGDVFVEERYCSETFCMRAKNVMLSLDLTFPAPVCI